jgi:F0F1-type ATP synthase membrane subunit c/vacuolar-type H+-ATPase subunit K
MGNEAGLIVIYMSAALCTGLGGCAAAMGEGQIGGYAMRAMGRQPLVTNDIMRTQLIGVAVTETGAIFSLVVSLLLIFGNFLTEAIDLGRAFSLMSAGFAMGIGCMGSGYGCGYTGAEACLGAGRVPSNNMTVTTNMLLGQALTQTSTIFALIIALLLLYMVPNVSSDTSSAYQLGRAGAYMASALVIGLGSFGTAMGVGYVCGKGAKLVARYKENQAIFLRSMFVGSAVVQTCVIYALVIAFLLILM